MDDASLGRLFLGLDAERLEEAQYYARAARVATHFTSRRLKYLDIGGIGRYGGALVFREHDENNVPVRKILVKYSHSLEGDEALRNEAEWLGRLRGAEHIVQMIPLAETNLNVSGTGKRPAIALEFLPYGTARMLIIKCQELRGRLPNRLLWHVMLCLARQMTAMAFPPNRGPDASVLPEQIQPGGDQLPLTHNSAHLTNLMIGDFTPTRDHDLIPIFKLIDFGHGRLEDDVATAVNQNSLNAAYLLMSLAMPELTSEQLIKGTIEGRTYHNYILKEINLTSVVEIKTCANKDFLYHDDIDELLQDLIALMCSRHYRPAVADIVVIAEHAVRERNLGSSDDEIRRLVQALILDGDVIGGPLDAPLPENQLGTSLQGLITAAERAGGDLEWMIAEPDEPAQAQGPTLFQTFNDMLARMQNTSADDVD
ncbi:hypothetical protein F5Y13DRAFT_199774 [Hypoxylon sp. FL1857]|nr:hypothetical protein F5Y13DRAFT_199774 [Hypoxylon sp. FL1857]